MPINTINKKLSPNLILLAGFHSISTRLRSDPSSIHQLYISTDRKDKRIQDASLIARQSSDADGANTGGFQEIFGTIVAGLGSKIQSSKYASEAAQTLKDASLEAEASYSGVNLDTEASRLIELQQAYQASARILQTARELFLSDSATYDVDFHEMTWQCMSHHTSPQGASTNLPARHWFLTERSQMPRTYPVSEGSQPLRVPPGSSGSKGVL